MQQYFLEWNCRREEESIVGKIHWACVHELDKATGSGPHWQRLVSLDLGGRMLTHWNDLSVLRSWCILHSSTRTRKTLGTRPLVETSKRAQPLRSAHGPVEPFGVAPWKKSSQSLCRSHCRLAQEPYFSGYWRWFDVSSFAFTVVTAWSILGPMNQQKGHKSWTPTKRMRLRWYHSENEDKPVVLKEWSINYIKYDDADTSQVPGTIPMQLCRKNLIRIPLFPMHVHIPISD